MHIYYYSHVSGQLGRFIDLSWVPGQFLESGLSHMLGVSWLLSVYHGFSEASQQTETLSMGPSPPYSPPCYHSKCGD